MGCHNYLLIALVSVVGLISALIIPASGQNSQDYVNAHNGPRSQVGVGPVSWNATLATYALNYANTLIGSCNLIHSTGPYGENLAKGSSSTFTGVTAVNMWAAEKQYYDHANNCCIGTNQCLHYTQLVWHDSTQIGCARVRCNNGWYFVICSYHQPGNWDGESPY